jgi:cytochrome b
MNPVCDIRPMFLTPGTAIIWQSNSHIQVVFMNQQNESIKVWDPLVRLFHWSLVIAFIIAYVTGEEEASLHAYAGYVILGLLGFRLLWGFIGTTYARFSNFLYSPQTMLEYLTSVIKRHPKHYLGHNPAGGLMVILMLLSLAFASYTGLKAYGAEGHGPLAPDAPSISLMSQAYADDDHDDHDAEHEEHHYDEYEHDENEEDEFWEEIHEASVSFLLLLVFLHVLGVIMSSYLHRENLVRAMLTGRKSANIQS